MAIEPGLYDTAPVPLAVGTEADLGTLPTQGFPGGVQIWARSTQLIYAWQPLSAAASVPGVSVAVPSGGAFVVVGGAGLAAQAEIRYVDKAGSDTNGGTLYAPFLTIAAALASITDATSTKPYVVSVGPGIYTGTFALKPWIFVRGAGRNSTVLSPVQANWIGTGFATGTQKTAVFQCSITSTLTVDFSLIGSTGACDFGLYDCLTAAIVVKGNNTSCTALLQGLLMNGNLTITNMGDVNVTAVQQDIGNIAASATDAYSSFLQIAGFGTFGTMTLTWTGANASNLFGVTLYNQVQLPPHTAPTLSGKGLIVSAPGYNLYATLTDADQLLSCYNSATATVVYIDGGCNTYTINPTAGRTITIDNQLFFNDTKITIKNLSAFVCPVVYTGGPAGTQSYIGPGGTLTAFYSRSGNTWAATKTTQEGKATLVAGVSPFIPADISASSSIVATLQDINGGVLGNVPTTKLADRVVGTRAGGGGFKITSVTLAGVTVVTDTGIYNWIVSGAP